jgi:hypothetical protein
MLGSRHEPSFLSTDFADREPTTLELMGDRIILAILLISLSSMIFVF